jgi:thiol-disulfide isomerase/thioredoxin
MPKLTNTLFLLCVLAVMGCTPAKKQEGKALPEALIDRIDLIDLDGNAIDLKDYKGKTVFLNYWATWCRPCIAEMPDIDAAAQLLANDDFVFLAASDESMEKIKNYVEQIDYSFTFVQSRTSVFDMDIMALPTTMIIDQNGKIVYNEVGARKWNSETEIEKLREIARQ